MKKVLFVCLGNICRSPLAQGVLEKALADTADGHLVQVDSAATSNYHTGDPPDPRAIAAAARRGIDISRQRARSVRIKDFSEFDRILAMDFANQESLKARCPVQLHHRIALFSHYLPGQEGAPVPDPYYGAEQGFETVLDLLERGMAALLRELNA